MKIINLSILSFALAFISCTDQLEQTNPNSPTTETYYKNINEASTALNSVYNVLKSKNTLGILEENTRGDLGVDRDNRGNKSTSSLFNQDFNSASNEIYNRWNCLYRGIFYANQVYEGLNKMVSEGKLSENSYDYKTLMGQVRFFRGLYHYWLSLLFNHGDIIIRTSVPKKSSEFYKSLSHKEDVMKFVIDEFQYAFENLPAKWGSSDQGRPTSGTVAAYLGQLYLYDKNYDESKKWLQIVMDINPEINNNYGYKLTKNLDDNFYEAGEFNSESIFEANYSLSYLTEYDGNSDFSISNDIAKGLASGGDFIYGYGTFNPALWLIDAYKNEDKDPLDERNYIDTIADTKMNQYLPKVSSATITEGKNIIVTKDITFYDGNRYIRQMPLRGVQSIAYCKDDCESLYYGYPPYCRLPKQNADGTIVSADANENLYATFQGQRSALFKKFTNCSVASGESQVGSKSAINFRLMRLADVYLMYAEDLIEGGTNDEGVSEALKYINRIRKRSALSLLGTCDGENNEYSGQATYLGGIRNFEQNKSSYPNQSLSIIPTENDGCEIVPVTAANLMKQIMWRERPLELAVEGFAMRAIDLRRWGVTKERFEDLYSHYRYDGIQYSTYSAKYNNVDVKVNGKIVVKRTGFFDFLRLPFDNENFQTAPRIDFQKASINYSDKDNSYYPIPQKELQSNPLAAKYEK